MIWTVRFKVKRSEGSGPSKEKFWANWSQFQVKVASQNLLAYLESFTTPVSIEHIEEIPSHSVYSNVSPRELMEIWYTQYWCDGRGLGVGRTVIVRPDFANLLSSFLRNNTKT